MSVVCFIAVSYFGSSDVGAYVDSLIAQTDARWSLKIVDNSQNVAESARLHEVAAKDARIEVWSAPSNLGYFGAAEWARSMLDPRDFVWISVTNTDVVLDTVGFVASLISLKNSGVSVVAPAIYGSRSRSSLNPYMYARPSVWRSRMRRLLFWNVATAQATVVISHLRRRASKGVDAPKAVVDIYAAHGCFMTFGRTFFASGGSFEHGSFLFGEELTIAEFCRVHGLRTTYFPQLLVRHTEHANTGVLRSRVVLESQVAAAKNALALITDEGVSRTGRER